MINYLNLNGIKTFLNKMRGEFLSKSDAASIYLKKSDAVSSGNAVTGGKQVEGGFALTNAAGEVVCTIPAAAFKANPNLSLSDSSISVTGGGNFSFQITRKGNGNILAVSNNENLTCTISDTTVICSAANADFTASITVIVDADDFYNSDTATFTVSSFAQTSKLSPQLQLNPSSATVDDNTQNSFEVSKLSEGVVSAVSSGFPVSVLNIDGNTVNYKVSTAGLMPPLQTYTATKVISVTVTETDDYMSDTSDFTVSYVVQGSPTVYD